MGSDGREKRMVEKRCRSATEANLSVKRRVEDAIENVVKLESLGLSRRIAVIVSARAFGFSIEKLTEMLELFSMPKE